MMQFNQNISEQYDLFNNQFLKHHQHCNIQNSGKKSSCKSIIAELMVFGLSLNLAKDAEVLKNHLSTVLLIE